MVQKEESPRQYPPVYEKFVPVILGILFVVIVGVMVFTVAVALGVLNF